MAVNKKTVIELKKDLETLDQTIENNIKKINKLRQKRQTLKNKIDTMGLFEIKGLLDERNITYEQAKDILNKANPAIDK